mmetsp:Transcript_3184/g.5757  ORF Transcript_3184/g.5757 Transcript_3184/m.5757 type:complete len:117 (-) Transcript_3184:154-504(-)
MTHDERGSDHFARFSSKTLAPCSTVSNRTVAPGNCHAKQSNQMGNNKPPMTMFVNMVNLPNTLQFKKRKTSAKKSKRAMFPTKRPKYTNLLVNDGFTIPVGSDDGVDRSGTASNAA